jgi:hypothetical protein
MKRLSATLFFASILIISSCTKDKIKVEYISIEATIADTIMMAGEYQHAKQYFTYPQINGMQNRSVQDSINNRLKIADFNQLKNDATYSEVKYVKKINEASFPIMYSYQKVEIYYISNDFISYGGITEFAGGAHPSFVLQPATTIDVNTLKPIDLDKLFTGDYKAIFREYIMKSEQLQDYKSDGMIQYDEFGGNCDDILDVILANLDTTNTTGNMILTNKSISILQKDFRDFGCAEYQRGIIEVSIPYSSLKKNINKMGYIQPFLK